MYKFEAGKECSSAIKECVWSQGCDLLSITNYLVCAHSMDFEYLSDVPILTLDVNEDFKQNDSKSADMLEKVSKSS